MADGDLSPELRQILRETIDPMSRTPRDTAEGLIKFSKFAEGLFADEEPREQLSTEAEPPEQLSTEVESRGELPGQEAA